MSTTDTVGLVGLLEGPDGLLTCTQLPPLRQALTGLATLLRRQRAGDALLETEWGAAAEACALSTATATDAYAAAAGHRIASDRGTVADATALDLEVAASRYGAARPELCASMAYDAVVALAQGGDPATVEATAYGRALDATLQTIDATLIAVQAQEDGARAHGHNLRTLVAQAQRCAAHERAARGSQE